MKLNTTKWVDVLCAVSGFGNLGVMLFANTVFLRINALAWLVVTLIAVWLMHGYQKNDGQ